MIGITILAGIGAVLLHLYAVSPPCSTAPHVKDLSDSRRYEESWKRCIAEVGGEEAYEHFSRTMQGVDVNSQHTYAHIFARALYASEGLKGLAVCDESFEQGCMHELMGRALYEYGPEFAGELAASCGEVFRHDSFFCYHGLGHGLKASSPDDEAGLKISVAQCMINAQGDSLYGCYTGVYMEYFLRNITLNGTWPRAMLGQTYGPCDTIMPQKAMLMCWYSLARWWHQLSKLDELPEREIFKVIRSRCMEVSDREKRKVCFSGAGHIVASAADYAVQDSKEYCAVLADGSSMIHTLCLSRTANAMLMSGMQKKAFQVCDDLAGDDRSYCEAYAKTLSVPSITIPLPGFGIEER